MAKRKKVMRAWGIMSNKRLAPVFYAWKPKVFEGEQAVPVEIRIAQPAKGKRKGAKR